MFCGEAELERPGSQVPAGSSSWPPALPHEKEFSKHTVGRGAWGGAVHEGITPGKHPIAVEPSVPQAVGGKRKVTIHVERGAQRQLQVFQGSPGPQLQFPWLRMRKIYFESLPLKSPLCQGQNSPSCWLSVLLWEGELTYMFTTGEAEAGVL